MLVIGLTGGIACGKSTASDYLSRLGAYRIDADQLAREVVLPGSPALREILETFGSGLVHSDGSLDRKALGDIVFNDQSRLEQLNRIIHPCIFAEQARKIEKILRRAPDPETLTIVVDAALMIEAGRHTNYDLVLVVYCPEHLQMERLQARDGFSRDQARKRILRQMPLLEKVDYADFVINTAGRKEETRRQIDHIWKIIQMKRNRWRSN